MLLGLERCCWGLKTRSWGSKSVAGWLKWVVEGSWVVETHAGGLKDEAGGLKTRCWWSRHMAGVDNAWLGSRMCGRDQKRMVEVENTCWKGLVMWWAVEGLEHVVGGVKVVVVVVIGCIMVLLVAISVVDT